MNKFNFCPNCANPIDEHDEKWACDKCGSEYWKNSKPCAGVLPIKNGKLLISKRGIEPYKGDYDLIGGFLKNGEHPEDGALREAKEETGLDLEIVHFLGSYMDKYGEGGDSILNNYFVCKILGGEVIPNDDVVSLHWVDINNTPSIAFDHPKRVVEDLRNWYEKEGKNILEA